MNGIQLNGWKRYSKGCSNHKKVPIPVSRPGGIMGAGGTGEKVAEINGDIVTTPSGMVKSGKSLVEIDGERICEPGGIASTGKILAVLKGNKVQTPSDMGFGSEVLAEIKGDSIYSPNGEELAIVGDGATQIQKAAAAVVLTQDLV